MPELPEVETTLNGVRPYLLGQRIKQLTIRQYKLRWDIESNLAQTVRGQHIVNLTRRGKYILIHFETGGLIIHLGMSGSLRVLLKPAAAQKHDHFDIVNQKSQIIRYRDPRKFGCLLYCGDDLFNHPRIQGLGIEPLSSLLNGQFLYSRSRNRSIAVKSLIMNGAIIVGVGNIYASEALFLAKIHPLRNCSRISMKRYGVLAATIKAVLTQAIQQGGTTLQDFIRVDGSPGYFEQSLRVYGRAGQRCDICNAEIKKVMISQRSTFYCPLCQT